MKRPDGEVIVIVVAGVFVVFVIGLGVAGVCGHAAYDFMAGCLKKVGVK